MPTKPFVDSCPTVPAGRKVASDDRRRRRRRRCAAADGRPTGDQSACPPGAADADLASGRAAGLARVRRSAYREAPPRRGRLALSRRSAVGRHTGHVASQLYGRPPRGRALEGHARRVGRHIGHGYRLGRRSDQPLVGRWDNPTLARTPNTGRPRAVRSGGGGEPPGLRPLPTAPEISTWWAASPTLR